MDSRKGKNTLFSNSTQLKVNYQNTLISDKMHTHQISLQNQHNCLTINIIYFSNKHLCKINRQQAKQKKAKFNALMVVLHVHVLSVNIRAYNKPYASGYACKHTSPSLFMSTLSTIELKTKV